MIIGAVSHYCTGVGAKFQFSYPIWGYLAKRYGVIPIERTKIKSAIGSLNKLERAIKNGTSAMISPEGTRSLDGKLGKFKKGAFHVAKNTGVTIIPVGLVGAYNAKNINDWRISPGSLITVFGNPIYKTEYETLDVSELSSFVQTKISELIDN
jgi:1-acyl-sn-glycerol-3-phosphate acyltransferase